MRRFKRKRRFLWDLYINYKYTVNRGALWSSVPLLALSDVLWRSLPEAALSPLPLPWRRLRLAPRSRWQSLPERTLRVTASVSAPARRLLPRTLRSQNKLRPSQWRRRRLKRPEGEHGRSLFSLPPVSPRRFMRLTDRECPSRSGQRCGPLSPSLPAEWRFYLEGVSPQESRDRDCWQQDYSR